MLRTRIFLNLIPFIAILIAVVIYAGLLFSRMASNVGRTVTENYRSDTIAQGMALALSRMDTALQRARSEDKAPARLMFDTNARIFEENLQAQFTNSANLAQTNVLLQVRSNYQVLKLASAQLLAPESPRANLAALYDNEIVPGTLAINLLLERIRDTNRANIFATGNTIQVFTRTITGLLILGLAIALAISAYASYKLSKAILQPIQTLTNAAREIGQGNLNLTVPVISHDELGELATTFNKMAAQLNDYRQGINERIVRLHRTMEAALASFTDPVFVLDTDGQVELSNRAARELCDQLSLDGDLPPKLAEAATRVVQNQTDFVPDSFDQVLSLRVKGGEKSFLPRIHLMRDSDTHIVGVTAVLHDVTRFRLLDDAKTNLVGTVSHELKTPLTSVRMVLHMLLEKTLGPLNPRQNDVIQTARRDSERLLRILDALLDIARLEAGASSLTKETLRPETLVQSIAEEARRHTAAGKFTITTHVPPGLPGIAVDRQQIGHVFHNFISNAFKHSPAGGVIQISAAADADRTGVQFAVRDEGAGIAEEFQGRIFDRFFRVPGQAKTGVGLGLSIAREIVVAHGGRVGVRSQLGKGSEFFFVLEGVPQR